MMVALYCVLSKRRRNAKEKTKKKHTLKKKPEAREGRKKSAGK